MNGDSGQRLLARGRGWMMSCGLLACGAGLSACSGYSEEDLVSLEQEARSATVPGSVVQPRLRADSVIARENLPRGRWRYEGKIPVAPPEADLEPVDDEFFAGDPTDEENIAAIPPTDRMAIVEPTGEVYSVEFTPEEQALITAVLEKRGFGKPVEGDEAETVPKGWVNGVDNRQRWGLAESTAAAYDRIGRFSNVSGCTATFVGAGSSSRYFILTASHCLFTSTGAAAFRHFEPRRDSCRTSTGGWITGCDQTPFGSWHQNGARIHYLDWLQNCNPNGTSAYCHARDIAIAEVSRPSGVAFPGAFGFTVLPTSSTANISHRGYPACYGAFTEANPNRVYAPDAPSGSVQPPNVCTTRTAYGRNTGTWGSPYEGGRGMMMAHSTSPGHSGGPYWVSGGYLVGVATGAAGNCLPLGPTSCTRPGRTARITEQVNAWMLDFMGL